MGDRMCRSFGAEINQAELFYKYVAATRLGSVRTDGVLRPKLINVEHAGGVRTN
jgi:hypothetical protein